MDKERLGVIWSIIIVLAIIALGALIVTMMQGDPDNGTLPPNGTTTPTTTLNANEAQEVRNGFLLSRSNELRSELE